MGDGFEPHGTILLAGLRGVAREVPPGRRRGVPGVVRTGVGREGLYRYPPYTLPGPIYRHILSLRPYPRPNEGLFEVSDEVSEIWV